jgi:hypothetical protein
LTVLHICKEEKKGKEYQEGVCHPKTTSASQKVTNLENIQNNVSCRTISEYYDKDIPTAKKVKETFLRTTLLIKVQFIF